MTHRARYVLKTRVNFFRPPIRLQDLTRFVGYVRHALCCKWRADFHVDLSALLLIFKNVSLKKLLLFCFCAKKRGQNVS